MGGHGRPRPPQERLNEFVCLLDDLIFNLSSIHEGYDHDCNPFGIAVADGNLKVRLPRSESEGSGDPDALPSASDGPVALPSASDEGEGEGEEGEAPPPFETAIHDARISLQIADGEASCFPAPCASCGRWVGARQARAKATPKAGERARSRGRDARGERKRT